MKLWCMVDFVCGKRQNHIKVPLIQNLQPPKLSHPFFFVTQIIQQHSFNMFVFRDSVLPRVTFEQGIEVDMGLFFLCTYALWFIKIYMPKKNNFSDLHSTMPSPVYH